MRAVLSERSSNPYLADKSTIEVLDELELGSKSRLPVVKEAFERVSRIIRDKSVNGDLQEQLLVDPAEQQLWTAYKQTQSKVNINLLKAGFKSWCKVHKMMKISEFLEVCDEGLVREIEVFFDEVFVMAEDLELRQNRLKLLNSIASLSSGVINFNELTGF